MTLIARSCTVLRSLKPQLLSNRCHLCSSSSSIGGPQQRSNKSAELRTGLFGCLTVHSPARPVEIASLDPAVHEDIGRVLVSAAEACDGEGSGEGILAARQTGERDWLVECDRGDGKSAAPLHVQVPVPMDLQVHTDSSCSVSVVENRRLQMTSNSPDNAKLTLDRVKSGDVSVSAVNGSATVSLRRTLLQSLSGQARLGLALRAEMYQGGEVSLASREGDVDVDVGAMYCRRCSLLAGGGDGGGGDDGSGDSGVRLRCGSAHGSFHVDCSGRRRGTVAIDSLEGSLNLRMLYGGAQLHLTRPRNVDICLGEGDIQLSLQPSDGVTEGAEDRVSWSRRDSPAAQQQLSSQQAPPSNMMLLDVTASGIDLDDKLTHLTDEVFPQGPHAVRLVTQLPCLSPVGPTGPQDDGEDIASGSNCTVRVSSGRVKLSVRASSNLFARLRSAESSAAGSAD